MDEAISRDTDQLERALTEDDLIAKHAADAVLEQTPPLDGVER